MGKNRTAEIFSINWWLLSSIQVEEKSWIRGENVFKTEVLLTYILTPSTPRPHDLVLKIHDRLHKAANLSKGLLLELELDSYPTGDWAD